MLIVDLYKYWHEQEEGKQRQLKKKKIQLFNPIIKGKKSLLGIGNIQMTFDLQGDSYRMNELESNGQLYSLGTVWDTLSDKKFDFYADRIDLDNNKGTCEINGFSLINLFNTQLRLDFSKTKYSKDGKYHSPNLLEIWQEIKESLIERDKIINSYFWKEMAIFKNSSNPSVGVDKNGNTIKIEVPEEAMKEFNKLTDSDTTKKVYEYNNYMGQNMVVNLWQFLRPLLVYCDYRLDMWLVDGVLNLKLKNVIKEPVMSLNEFKDLLTIEDMKPKYNIIEASVKYESVIPTDGKIEVEIDEYKNADKSKQLDPVPYIYSEMYEIDDNFDEEKQKPYKKANGDFDESKIRVLDITYVYGKYLDSSYTWEKFNFDKSLPIMIREGFIWEYDEYLNYGETEKHKGIYNANIFLKWTQDKKYKYYIKKQPKITPRPTNDISTVRYALNTENKIVKLADDTLVDIKLPFNLAYFEEKTLAEAQSKAILTLAKNRYAYRITYIANVDTYKQPFYVGDYVEVYFYGKTLKLPITEIEYENIDNQLQETIILGADIPEIEELVAYGVKKGAEVKV